MSEAGLTTQLARRTVENRVPLRVHFDLTYRCNERCVHCYLNHDDQGELSTEEIKDILDQVKRVGTFFLTFSGGEVLLRSDFLELLVHARNLHFDICVKTNGTLIDRALAYKIKTLGVRLVQISVYSPNPEIHEAITRIQGSLARSLAGIELLRQHGVAVKIACPIMDQNIGDWRGVAELASALGITYTLDPTISPSLNGDKRVLALRKSASELLPILSNAALATECVPHTEAQNTLAATYADIPCSAGHNSCYISPYGDVYPCVQLPIAAGNLRHLSFHEVWYGSPRMLDVAAVRGSQIAICSQCSIRQYCERCPGLAHLEDGSFAGPSRRACELAEARATLAGVSLPVSAVVDHVDDSRAT